MSGKEAAGILLLIGGAAAITGYGLYSYKKPSSAPSPSSASGLALTVSGPSTVTQGNTHTYNVMVNNNNSPVGNASVTIYANSRTTTATTDSDGIATFNIAFSTVGTATMYAEYDNVKSNTLHITVKKPASTCSGNSSCPSGENCINGQCTPLEATDISIPVSATISGYMEMIAKELDLIPQHNTYKYLTSYSTSCPSSDPTKNTSITTSPITISGKVLSGTMGINKAPLEVNVSGGNEWTGSNGMAGICHTVITTQTQTDSNGNFSIKVSLLAKVTTPPNLNNGVNHSPSSMNFPVYTIKVSSMGLTKDIVVSVNMQDYSIICDYYKV